MINMSKSGQNRTISTHAALNNVFAGKNNGSHLFYLVLIFSGQRGTPSKEFLKIGLHKSILD